MLLVQLLSLKPKLQYEKIEIDNPIQIETTSPQNQRSQQISISEHQESDAPISRATVILE